MNEREKIAQWFSAERESYPWREDPTPYKVWISEVMSQQTQMSRVILYFDRWMEALPSVASVAAASEETLMKLWEGLGYYSRVRNIQKAAVHLINRSLGVLPATYEELISIPGMGPYTASAILCFAFKKKGYPVDANLLRFFSRYHGFYERIDTSSGKKAMQAYAEEWIDGPNFPLIAEGLIEFGQKICTKKPSCQTCFLRKNCVGKADAERLPIKKIPTKTAYVKRSVLLLVSNEKVWVYREEGKRMHGLWQFPYVDTGDLQPLLANYPAIFVGHLPVCKQGYTHYSVTLTSSVYSLPAETELPFGEWRKIKALYELPFCSGHKQIAKKLAETKRFGKPECDWLSRNKSGVN